MLFTRCNTYRPALNRNKSVYIHEFKLTYFKKLLQAGFNNSNAVNSLIEFDKSGFTEPVLTLRDYRFIDSIVRSDNLKMSRDSLESIGRVAEGAEGKHVFEYLLERLQSNRLDSLARHRYRSSCLESGYKK
jgi:hypothetical protein